jgi:hypothetical protein
MAESAIHEIIKGECEHFGSAAWQEKAAALFGTYKHDQRISVVLKKRISMLDGFRKKSSVTLSYFRSA